MRWHSSGISTGGEQRLRAAIEAQVWQEHQEELRTVTDFWQKIALHERIRRKIRERMKRLATPYSLWGS